MYDAIMVEGPTRDLREDIRSQDHIVGSQDMTAVDEPPDHNSDNSARREVKVEVEKAPSADSSFSEATDKDQLDDEGLERDSLSDDLDEIMVLENPR